MDYAYKIISLRASRKIYLKKLGHMSNWGAYFFGGFGF